MQTGYVLRHMLVSVQVILAVLQPSRALGTVAEIKAWVVLLRPAADSALVDGSALGHNLHLAPKIPFPLNLPGTVALIAAGHGHKQDHVEQGQNDLAPAESAPELP